VSDCQSLPCQSSLQQLVLPTVHYAALLLNNLSNQQHDITALLCQLAVAAVLSATHSAVSTPKRRQLADHKWRSRNAHPFFASGILYLLLPPTSAPRISPHGHSHARRVRYQPAPPFQSLQTKPILFRVIVS
jgi:hypothetical protein